MELEEEVEIIDVQEEQVKEIIRQFLNNEKALSFSALKAFAESPAAFIQYQLRQRKTTPTMIFGSLVHCLILEPEKFPSVYAVLDDTAKCINIGGKSPRQTNAYKEWKADFIALNEGKTVISIDVFDRAAAVANNVNFNKASRPILEMCTEREVHVEWNFLNIKHHGFIDARTPKDAKTKVKCDIKTCIDASPKKFQRDIINNKHYLQAAMYGESDPDGYSTFYFIAVDQKGGVSVHRIEPPLLEYGMKEYAILINAFNRCLITESFDQSHEFWSNNKSGVFDVSLPAYLQ